MDVLIPPREHGPLPSSYPVRNMYDEHGNVTMTTRSRGSEATIPHKKSSSQSLFRRARRWPFQSIATLESSSSSDAATMTTASRRSSRVFFRRATWVPQQRGLLLERDGEGEGGGGDDDDDDARSHRSALIPDYVVNYLRGETPESVARRKRNGGKIAERGVELEPGRESRLPRSRAGVLEGFELDFGGARGRGRGRLDGVSPDQLFCDEDASSVTRLRTASGGWWNGGGWGSSADIEGGRYPGVRRRRSPGLTHGWRGGVAFNVLFVFLIFTASLVCFVLAVTSGQRRSSGANAAAEEEQAIVYSGSLQMAASINRGLHAAVNVLGVALLAGANYVFQVLGSPTRWELDAAHGRRKWLDIGSPALRNLQHVSRVRGLLALFVVVTAVAAQVILNSFTFPTQQGVHNSVGGQSAGSPASTVIASSTLLGIAAILTFVSLLVITTVLFGLRFDPLVTLGDAITSYLREPDPTTNGACLLSGRDVREGHWAPEKARSWQPGRHLWFASPTALQWCSAALVWASTAGLAAGALAISIGKGSISGDALLLSPFDTAATSATRTSYALPASTPAAAAAILASLPQLLLAILYLTTNALATAYFVSRELSLFALTDTHRPLRVSAAPEGQQTTSLYLTLPRPWSWSLITIFAAMGLALSQSVSPVLVTADGSGSGSGSGNVIATAAVSFNASWLVILLGLLGLLAALVLGLGFLRAPDAGGDQAGNPLVALASGARGGDGGGVGAGCSAALSARCHGHPGEEAMWQQPVAWGVVVPESGATAGHCAFSAGAVGQLDANRSYA